jgi:7,8-dihydroneopterin aldolase/epimerase/oxygenase
MKVFIRNLEFYSYHGVPPEERVVGHRYRFDISLEIASSSAESDEVSDTVDYVAVAKCVEEVTTTIQCKTLERLVTLVGNRILDQFSLVVEVTVRTWKPLPPAPIIADSVGVELTVRRTGMG